MARAHGIRTGGLALALLAALVAVTSGCDSGSSPTAPSANGPGCDKWCGSGTATVTFVGATTKISGGGCYDGGSAGFDIRFGDWQGLSGTSSYLQLTAYRDGGPTPTPAATANPAAAPTATDHPSVIASGSVGGDPFVLVASSDTVVSFRADGTGSFSGNDVNGNGTVQGTFACG
jgi:hypothetical protein